VKVKWLPSAEDDIDNIVDYIDPVNPAAARKMIMRIQQAVERLQPYPFVSRQGKVPHTRELVVNRTPYIVVYAVEQDQIVVQHVLHTSQQWPPEDE
jgi:toxin ParE1/3/4